MLTYRSMNDKRSLSKLERRTNLKYNDRLVKMVVFHRGSSIYRRQGRGVFHHERVGLTPVIHVVAKTGDEQGEALADRRGRQRLHIARGIGIG